MTKEGATAPSFCVQRIIFTFYSNLPPCVYGIIRNIDAYVECRKKATAGEPIFGVNANCKGNPPPNPSANLVDKGT